MNSELKSAS